MAQRFRWQLALLILLYLGAMQAVGLGQESRREGANTGDDGQSQGPAKEFVLGLELGHSIGYVIQGHHLFVLAFHQKFIFRASTSAPSPLPFSVLAAAVLPCC